MNCALDDSTDLRNLATKAYHRLVKQGDQSDEVITELVALLEITADEIEVAMTRMCPVERIQEIDLDDLSHVATVNVISSKIGDHIGPEGLAIVEILTALDRPTPSWLLEAPQSNKAEIGHQIIQELHAIRDSGSSLPERAAAASKVLESHRKDLPAVSFAQRRIEDLLALHTLTEPRIK